MPVTPHKLGVPARLASVSFVNSLPLNYGLDSRPDLQLQLAVPSKLLGLLQRDLADVALLPAIDYQHLPGARIIAATGIGCEGPTLTVRLFCKQPIDQIKVLACDSDSHTSVALAQIILAEQYALRPRLIPLEAASANQDEALLLIGDKVVCAEPAGFDFQYDLGEQWHVLSGLPFVFAIWTARSGFASAGLRGLLIDAKNSGMEHVERLVDQVALKRGWPRELALAYLTKYLKFDIGPRQLEAIALFHQLAAKHGLIDQARPIELLSD